VDGTVIEDFFRLQADGVRYFPKRTITSPLAVHTFSAALAALKLQQVDPLTATLHYLRDLLSFGFEKPAVSDFTTPDGQAFTNPPETRAAVKQLINSQGSELVQRVMAGMMYHFPGDCFPDASGVVMSLFELLPHDSARWVEGTIQLLPQGSLKQGEGERLMKGIAEKIDASDTRKTRALLQG
jgi:transportin-3